MSPDLRRFAWHFFEHRPHLSPVEWCEAELSLSSLVSAHPGPYSTFARPHVREPLNCFGDTTTTDLVLCWAAQTDKTTTLGAGTLFRLKNRPTPALVVFPNEDLAGSFSENRLQPLLESSPQLRALKPEDGDKFKRLEWQLSTATLAFVGSNSPANLASRAVGLIIGDEIDKFAQADSKEAGALELATERTKSYEPVAKRVYASTPTTEDGPIWVRFLKGTQEYRYLPCPHCAEFIRLEWPNVKWDQDAKDEKTGAWDYTRVISSAHYACQKCSGKITDAHKTKMLRAGEWRASNPAPLPGWRSFHLNSLYSANLTFGKLAVSFIEAKRDGPSALQNFQNSTLAEPWAAEKPLTVTEEKLTALLGTNERCTYDENDGGVNLILSDKQADGSSPYIVRRFYRGMRSHLIDWGIALEPAELDAAFDRYKCRFGGVDTGHRTREMYSFIADRPQKWTGLKGGKLDKLFVATSIDPYHGGKDAGKITIPLLHVSDEHWSRELFDRLDGRVSGWTLTKEIDATYQHQITGVRRVNMKGKDGNTSTLLRYRPPFDLWDCEKYALCLAYAVGLGRTDIPPPDNPRASVEDRPVTVDLRY